MLNISKMVKVDKKDILVLRALDVNPRMSYTQIGKYSKLSKETVQYRYKRLTSEGILKGFWMVPKINSGINAYKVLLKSKGLSNESFERIKNFLLDSKVVSWMAVCNGYWNIHLTLLSSKDAETSKLLKELFTTFSSFFVDIQFHKSVAVHAFHEKYLYDKVNSEYYYGSFLDKPIEIGEIDNKILDLISLDARIRFTDIGTKVHLTPEAILARFKKVKSNIGMLKPRIDHSKLGLSYYHLWLRLADGKLIKDVVSYCARDKYSVFIMEHLGKYHLHIEIVCGEKYIDNYISDLMQKFEKDVLEYDLCKIVSELKIRVNSN